MPTKRKKSTKSAAQIRAERLKNLEKARAARATKVAKRGGKKVRVKLTEAERKAVRSVAAKKAAATRRLNREVS